MDIQFTIEDIIRQAPLLQDSESSALRHFLKSDLANAARNSWIAADEGDHSRRDRAYIHNIASLGYLALNHLNLESETDAEGYIRTLNTLLYYLPVSQIKNTRDLEIADLCFRNAFYCSNLFFSEEFQRDTYLLDKDIKNFLAQNKEFRHPAFIGIETHSDYFTNVVMPLISNVLQHAFPNPGQPIAYGMRFMQEDGVTVEVYDEGVGMPDIDVFAKGTSSKGEGHGLGLWEVKKFVESRGGRIWYETSKKGTSFYFTIPPKEIVQQTI